MENWLKRYEEIKHLLVSPVNFSDLFEKSEIGGKELSILNMGKISFSTGQILVRDPLVRLHKAEKPYMTRVPVGEYDIETLVVRMEEGHYRYIATRVRFKKEASVIYHQAMIGNENLDEVDSDTIYGFEVDAGLATIVDVKTRDAYCDFVAAWYKENKEKNIYDDFFADEFRKSYLNNPQFQREGGDWINFKIPDTKYSIPMIQSGFGDGNYPVYFGYDKEGVLCDIVVEYIFVG